MKSEQIISKNDLVIGQSVEFYTAKYCLTHGYIHKYRGTVCKPVPNYPAFVQRLTNLHSYRYYHGNDWHLTLQEAEADAERRRQRAIAAAERKMAKLEQMQFKCVDEDSI